MNQYRYKSLDLQIKNIDAKEGIVEGYFSAHSVVDSYGEMVMPGAFTKTIKEQGPKSNQPRIKHLLNHDVSKPLGKLIGLKEDDYGLWYRSQIGRHSLGQDFIKMAEDGLVTEHSIGYQVMKWEREENKKQSIFKITEAKLFEGSSLTGWGVNQFTPLTAIKADQANDRLKRLEKFVRNTDATDETIELLLIEIRQLNQVIYQLKATQPEKSTVPEIEKVEDIDWSRVLKAIQ